MADTGVADFVLVRSRWRAAAPVAVTLAFRVLILGYCALLSVPPIVLGALALLLGIGGLVALAAVVTTLSVPPAVVHAGGFRLRRLTVSPALTDIAWADVRAVWITYFGPQRSLAVLAGSEARAYVAPIPEGTIDAGAVIAAVHELSGGRVTVSDTPPPRPQSGSPAFRLGGYGRAHKTSPWLAYLPWVAFLLVLPWLTHTAQPWSQPWWPGNH